jgi:hypothetical protein
VVTPVIERHYKEPAGSLPRFLRFPDVLIPSPDDHDVSVVRSSDDHFVIAMKDEREAQTILLASFTGWTWGVGG